MTTIVKDLPAPSVEDPLYSVADTITRLRDALVVKFDTWGAPTTTFTPASGWGQPSSATRALPKLYSLGPFVALQGGTVELKTGSVAFSAGGDVLIGTFASSSLLPTTDVAQAGVAHFATGIPVFCRVVLSPAGQLLVRVDSARTMPSGAASLVLCPSAVWLGV